MTDTNVTLRCFGCKQTFNGTKKADGSIKSSGMRNHLIQSLHKNTKRRPHAHCINAYQSRNLVNWNLVDDFPQIDISTSVLEDSLQEDGSDDDNDEASFNAAPDNANNDSEEQTDEEPMALPDNEEFHPISTIKTEDYEFEYDYSEIFFADLLLKPSNTLTHGVQFSNMIHKESTFAKDSMLSKQELNEQSFPSTNLLPPISLKTILSYDKNKLRELKGHTKHILKQLEHLPFHPTMDQLSDSEEELQSEEELESVVDTEDEQGSEGEGEEAEHGNQQEEGHQEDEEALHTDQQGQDPFANNPYVSPMYLLDRKAREQEKRQRDPPKGAAYIYLLMMQLQAKHGFSLAAVNDIYQWAHKAVRIQRGCFDGNPPNRNGMLKEYKEQLGLAEGDFEFQEEIVHYFPDVRPTVMHCRHFLDAVYELLTKESLLGHNSENISLPHNSDPFKYKPDEPPDRVEEMHHGEWWGKTMRQKRKGKGSDSIRITCPVPITTDETPTDTNGRLPVTPVNIQLGIFNNKTRKKEDASTTLFFLPDDTAEASHHQQKTLAIHKLQNLHTALRNGFKELKYLMDNDIGVFWDLYYGGKTHRVELVFSIPYIISDTAMHNKLCCKYNNNNDNVRKLCRHCDIESEDLIDVQEFQEAELWSPDDFDVQEHDPAGDPDYWKSRSHHPVVNALDELCFGSNKHKTHLATPGELLHMHQKGALKRSVESFVYQFRLGTKITTDNQAAAKKQKGVTKGIDHINYSGHQIGVLLSRQSDRRKPRTKFKAALLRTKKMCGHEHSGVVLCLLLLLLTDRGRQICLEERTMNVNFLDNFVYIFEMVLIIEQWMKQDSMPKEVLDTKRLYKALAIYIENVGHICKRKGMGPKVPKNHLMLHIPQYIKYWGIPSGWDGSNLERGHKTETKAPAQLTQRRQDTFIGQLCKRVSESGIFKKAMEAYGILRSLWNRPAEAGSTKRGPRKAVEGKPVCGGTRFEVGLSSLNGKPAVRWQCNVRKHGHIQVAIDTVYDNIVANMPPALTGGKRAVSGFTEYKLLINGEQEVFRAHPSYRSRSRQQRDVWYDWALFDLKSQGYADQPIPGQILMFIHVPILQEEVSVSGMKVRPLQPHAVVRLFQKPSTPYFREQIVDTDTQEANVYSMLVEYGDVNDHLHIIPCSCIYGPTIVIPNLPILQPSSPITDARKRREKAKITELIAPLGGGFFVISPMSDWKNRMSDLIQSFRATPRRRTGKRKRD